MARFLADAVEERGSADVRTIAREQWGHKIYPGNKNGVRVNPINVGTGWPERLIVIWPLAQMNTENSPTNPLSSDCRL